MKKHSLFVVAIAALLAGFFISYDKAAAPTSQIVPEISASTAETGTAVPAATSPAPTSQHSIAAPTDPQDLVKSAAFPKSNISIVVGSSTYRSYAEEGSTVADVMRSLAAKGALKLTYREFGDMGLFVESIDGIYGAGDHYWFLYINGESSMSGASQTALKDGDVVEWRYKQRE